MDKRKLVMTGLQIISLGLRSRGFKKAANMIDAILNIWRFL
jgi:hypothetical protein